MAEFQVRRATLDDAAGIALVHVRSWQATYAGHVPQEALDEMDPVARTETVRRWLEPGRRGTTLVAVQPSGAVIGFANFGPCAQAVDDDSLGEVYAIYLHPDHLGTGAGYALMTAALRELATQGRHEVRLWVFSANERARRFYERVGFAVDGETSVFRLERGGNPPVELHEVRYVFDGRPAVA